MAIQYPQFQGDPTVQADFSGLANIFKNIASGYDTGLMPYKLQQQKKAQDLQNALTKSQIDFSKMQQQSYPEQQQAQIQEQRARAGLYGAQAQQAQNELELQRQMMGMFNANPQQIPQAEMQQQIYNRAQQPGLSIPLQQQYIEKKSQQNITPQNQMQPISNGQISQQNQLMQKLQENPQLAAYVAKNYPQFLKMNGKEEFYPDPAGNAGTRVRKDMFGNIVDIQYQQLGPTKEEEAAGIARAKGMQEAAVETYKNSVADYGATTKILQNLSGVMPLLTDPNIDKNVGRFNNAVQSIFGINPGADINGTMSTLFGNVQAELTNTVQGSAARSKIQLMDRIKPSAKDPLPVLIGKFEALNNITKWSNEYSKRVGQLLENDPKMTPLKAEEMASKEIPFNKYQGEITRISKLDSLAKSGKKIYRNNGQYFIGVPQTGEAVLLDEYEQYLKNKGIK